MIVADGVAQIMSADDFEECYVIAMSSDCVDAITWSEDGVSYLKPKALKCGLVIRQDTVCWNEPDGA